MVLQVNKQTRWFTIHKITFDNVKYPVVFAVEFTFAKQRVVLEADTRYFAWSWYPILRAFPNKYLCPSPTQLRTLQRAVRRILGVMAKDIYRWLADEDDKILLRNWSIAMNNCKQL